MRLDRRDFGKLLAAGAASSIAGCGGGDSSGVSEEDLEGRSARVITRATTPIQLNPFAIRTGGGAVWDFLDQLVMPVVEPTGELLTSGHEWTVDGSGVSVPCAVADYEVNPPDGYTLTFDDRLTYWNGEALDARAYYLHDHVQYLLFQSSNGENAFPGELVSDTEYRRRPVEGHNRMELESRLHPGEPPLPPSFTRPYHDRLLDASTGDQVDSIFAEISGVEITFRTMVEEGYGTGAYAIESVEDIYNGSFVARVRDDHPADVAIPNLVVQWVSGAAATSAFRSALESGDVDVGEAIIAEGGDLNPRSTSDKLEQLATYPSPRSPGHQVLFNWGNEHLRRLWVRRAIVAALPFRQAISNVWGPTRRSPANDTGLLSGIGESALGSDFVSRLRDYPIAANTETATAWMERAGYRKRDGTLYDPDGSPMSLTILIGRGRSARTSLGQTFRNALESFGIETGLRSLRGSGYTGTIEGGSYDLALGFAPGGWSPVSGYGPDLSLQRGFLWGSPLAIAGNPLDTCESDPGIASKPGTVTLPEEPGALTVEGASYEDGGTTYRHDGGVDASICETANRLTAAETDEAELLEAARTCAQWYNYAVPNFVFAQERIGPVGNVREFTFPANGSEATKVTRYETGDPAEYHVQAGTIR